MDTHTVSRLLVLVATALSFTYCHALPGGRQEPDGNLTDPHVWVALRAIQHLFINNARPRAVERIVSTTVQVRSEVEVTYKYVMEVSDGITRELCNVTILSRQEPTGEQPAIRVVDPPQCYPQDLESDQHKNATIRRKRSDPRFEDAVDFLDREMTIQTNSSRYLRFKNFSKRVLKDLESDQHKNATIRRKRSDPRFEDAVDFLDREMTIQTNSSRYLRFKNFSKRVLKNNYYVIYNAEFAKSACTLEYMDMTHDYWGVCYVPWITEQTVTHFTDNEARKFREKLSAWLKDDNHTFTTDGQIGTPTLQNIAHWAADAWQNLGVESIRRGCLRCSHALDRSETSIPGNDLVSECLDHADEYNIPGNDLVSECLDHAGFSVDKISDLPSRWQGIAKTTEDNL